MFGPGRSSARNVWQMLLVLGLLAYDSSSAILPMQRDVFCVGVDGTETWLQALNRLKHQHRPSSMPRSPLPSQILPRVPLLRLYCFGQHFLLESLHYRHRRAGVDCGYAIKPITAPYLGRSLAARLPPVACRLTPWLDGYRPRGSTVI